MSQIDSYSPPNSATQIAAAVNSGATSSVSIIQSCLQKIERHNPELNCFTAILKDRALARAADMDARIAQGLDVGPLAGVPFAVKNLFDVEKHITLAGSKINADMDAAHSDAILINRLENAGAVLVGTLAMGEYAYDFTGENQHYGACKNPWDLGRMSGGSSSGSGSALAAGIVPITLGSDTNGSIRVPASLCGTFGLKPTYGRLPRTGTYPFCDSLDHLGPLARNTHDLALSYDLMQGWDAGDTACAQVDITPTYSELDNGIADLKIARAQGYFSCAEFPIADSALDLVCATLGATDSLALEGAAQGRAAAYMITNAEGSALHRTRIQTRIEDFDQDTRERFLAGCLIPSGWYLRAQQVRRCWQDQMLSVFEQYDLIIAASTPVTAPKIGTNHLVIGGVKQLLRPNLGLFTQPFSAIGLPVVSVPIWLGSSELPIGVQIVAPPWREDLALRAAQYLEDSGVACCRTPPDFC